MNQSGFSSKAGLFMGSCLNILQITIVTFIKTAVPKPSKQNVIHEARDYVIVTIGMTLHGIGWTVFLLPNDIITGEVPGIASIVYWVTGLLIQYTYFSINSFLLLLALKLLGLKFYIKTIFGVFTLTLFLSVIQKLTTGFGLLHDRPFTACVIGVSFCGGGIGVAFSASGSTGGTDITVAIIDRHRDITLGRIVFICDMIIISSSCFVLKDWEKMVYGFVTLYICSSALDQVVNNTRQFAQFFIIPSKCEGVGQRINEYPYRRVTIIDAAGFYTGREVKMMSVLAKRRESSTIFRLVKDIDPNVLVSQSAAIGVHGEGFDHIKVE